MPSSGLFGYWWESAWWSFAIFTIHQADSTEWEAITFLMLWVLQRGLSLPSGCFGYCLQLYHLLWTSLTSEDHLFACNTAWGPILLFWVLWVLHGDLNGDLLTSSGYCWYCIVLYVPLPRALGTACGSKLRFWSLTVMHRKIPLSCFLHTWKTNLSLPSGCFGCWMWNLLSSPACFRKQKGIYLAILSDLVTSRGFLLSSGFFRHGNVCPFLGPLGTALVCAWGSITLTWMLWVLHEYL